jgi:hypothetical protein
MIQNFTDFNLKTKNKTLKGSKGTRSLGRGLGTESPRVPHSSYNIFTLNCSDNSETLYAIAAAEVSEAFAGGGGDADL